MTKAQYNMDKYGVSWFKFNESAPSSIIDSRGSATAIVTGTTIITGVTGNARTFNGTSDFIRFNNPVIPVGAKSIRFKFRAPSNLPNRDTYLMLNLSSYASQNGMGVQVQPSTGTISFGNSAGSQGFRFWIQSTISVCDNQWHDIFFTWDGTTNANTVKLYIDDMSIPHVMATSKFSDAIAYAEVLQIARLASTSFYAKFDLDELEVYKDVIDPFEHKILFSSGDKYYSLTDSVVYRLSINNEKNFLSYGAGSITNFNGYLTKMRDIKNTITALGPGKTFEHSIDISKRRVDKIGLG